MWAFHPTPIAALRPTFSTRLRRVVRVRRLYGGDPRVARSDSLDDAIVTGVQRLGLGTTVIVVRVRRVPSRQRQRVEKVFCPIAGGIRTRELAGSATL